MKSVACPRCEASVEWTPQNKWRPFCSERCKLVDFGAWANEEYRVAGSSATGGAQTFDSDDSDGD
jgi:uncharacterized protein